MNWVKKRKLSATEAIQYNRCLCIQLEDLWEVLHNIFNSAQNWQIDISLLDEVPYKNTLNWLPFSKVELINTIYKYNNSSTSSPDKLLWSHLKVIVKNNECINKLIDITNTCIDLGY